MSQMLGATHKVESKGTTVSTSASYDPMGKADINIIIA